VLLFGTGRVVHRGGAVAFLEGELRNATNELIATATATARLIQVKPGGFQL
jgi:acyl-coenzyme A thioesterase PaaI-like protein